MPRRTAQLGISGQLLVRWDGRYAQAETSPAGSAEGPRAGKSQEGPGQRAPGLLQEGPEEAPREEIRERPQGGPLQESERGPQAVLQEDLEETPGMTPQERPKQWPQEEAEQGRQERRQDVLQEGTEQGRPEWLQEGAERWRQGGPQEPPREGFGSQRAQEGRGSREAPQGPGGRRPRAGLLATILELVYEVLLQPVATFRDLPERRPVGATVILFLFNLLTTLVVTTATVGRNLPPFLAGFLSSFTLTMGFLTALAAWVGVAGVLQILAELFGGQGRGFDLWLATALAALPGIFYVPVNLLTTFLGAKKSILVIALFLWQVILTTLAVREIHRLSTLRAMIVVLLPILFFLLSLVIMAALALALAGSLPLAPSLWRW